MNNRPTEADVQESRQHQLHPLSDEMEAALESLAASPIEQQNTNIESIKHKGELGLKTSTPSNYENSFGGEPRSLTSFEVKKPPGRL